MLTIFKLQMSKKAFAMCRKEKNLQAADNWLKNEKRTERAKYMVLKEWNEEKNQKIALGKELVFADWLFEKSGLVLLNSYAADTPWDEEHLGMFPFFEKWDNVLAIKFGQKTLPKDLKSEFKLWCLKLFQDAPKLDAGDWARQQALGETEGGHIVQLILKLFVFTIGLVYIGSFYRRGQSICGMDGMAH